MKALQFLLSVMILLASSTIVGAYSMPAIGIGFGILGFIRMFGFSFNGVLGMAFTTDGSTYAGKELIEGILRPSIERKLPAGIRLFETGGSRICKVTYWGPASHNAVVYADDFQGGNNATRIQKDFHLGEWKTENSYSKQVYLNLIHEQSKVITKDSVQNDIFKTESMEKLPNPLQSMISELNGTTENVVATIAEWAILMRGVDISIFNMFWLADKDKLALEASGIFPNKVAFTKYDADIRLNMLDGVWANIIANAATSPTANQIQKVNITLSAVSESRVITLTGSSGTCNITILGKTKLATFNASLDQTVTDFVTANAAYYAAFGMVITAGTATITCVYSGYKGVAFAAPTVSAAITGNLTGSVAGASPAAVPAGALGTTDSITIFNAMIAAQGDILKEMEDSEKVIYATKSLIDNYKFNLGLNGTSLGTLQAARDTMISGIQNLQFNGIRIEAMKIDSAITAYFGGYSPHRAILTTTGNLCLVASWADKFGEAKSWFNVDANAHRTRVQGEIGGDYFFPELMVVAFQG